MVATVVATVMATATALGVNPTALAATCALESNCSANVGGTGTISGAFQMSNGTYAQTVSEVQASNPDLASTITTKNDPASQSIAESYSKVPVPQAPMSVPFHARVDAEPHRSTNCRAASIYSS